ncbi:hypothetical protein PENTCL1PPCAC_15015, partial [Pristionchus entomophagus]
LQIFILQAFPRPAPADDVEKAMKSKGLEMMPYMPVSSVGYLTTRTGGLPLSLDSRREGIEADAKPMKERVRKLAETCTKCVVFEIDSVFLNEAGNFTV